MRILQRKLKLGMKKKDRYKYLLDYFQNEMPRASTELEYGSAYQLLVAVILSAQCTDKRVNMITPVLFERYPDAKSMADAEPDEVYEYVKSVSYPNAKARYLVDMSRMLMTEYSGEVPQSMGDLLKLPGVGRKTANVMQAVAFGRSAIAVDTHVFRISERLGLTTGSKNPLQTEKELVKYIPEHLIPKAHHWLILHGRYVCVARKPKCEQCGLQPWCRYFAQHRNPLA